MTLEEAFQRHLTVVGIMYKEWFALLADPQLDGTTFEEER